MSESELLDHFHSRKFLDVNDKNQYGAILSRVLALSHPKNILEIGFFTGNSALCWLHLSGANLTSVDPMVGVNNMSFDGSIDNVQVLKDYFGERFIFIQKDSKLVRPDLAGKSFDLIYVDGDHSPEGVYNDLRLALDLNIPWVLVDDFSGAVAEVFGSKFSERFEFVEEFHRRSDNTSVPMRLFKKTV